MEKAEELLNLAIEKFYVDKLELDNFKKSTEKYNKEIKDLMQKLNTTVFKSININPPLYY